MTQKTLDNLFPSVTPRQVRLLPWAMLSSFTWAFLIRHAPCTLSPVHFVDLLTVPVSFQTSFIKENLCNYSTSVTPQPGSLLCAFACLYTLFNRMVWSLSLHLDTDWAPTITHLAVSSISHISQTECILHIFCQSNKNNKRMNKWKLYAKNKAVIT